MSQDPQTNRSPDHDLLHAGATNLDEMVANTCFCKLRAFCPDKTSEACMKHRNIYQEFMRDKHALS